MISFLFLETFTLENASGIKRKIRIRNFINLKKIGDLNSDFFFHGFNVSCLRTLNIKKIYEPVSPETMYSSDPIFTKVIIEYLA